MRSPALGPRFDRPVPAGGYSWWYVDAISEDGRYGLTIIAFIGSVFSPYYRLSGRGRPEDHCAINVALTAPGGIIGGDRWTMTERGAASVARDAASFSVGPSSLRWDGDTLIIDIDERCATLPFPVRGRVRVTPQVIGTTAFALDADRKHLWHPLSPRAHVDAAFDAPGLRWTGEGYLDSNNGSEPLEDGFVDWQWSRAHLTNGDVAVIYEGDRRDGSDFAMALRCGRDGHWSDETLPPRQHLLPTPFLMRRSTRVDAGHRARVTKTWLDAPFYARSALRTQLFGQPGVGVHESLSLDRLVLPVVQGMLPYRMPRRP